MELKKLYELAESGEVIDYITGVTIGEFNDDFYQPYEGLKEIGFICEFEKIGNSWGIRSDLIDLIISYRITQMPVILEVPSQYLREHISANDLVLFADNSTVALSILPPGHPLVSSDVTIDEYSQILRDINQVLLTKPNIVTRVTPVSNYITYLMLEAILGEKLTQVFNVKDEYIINNFTKVMSEEDSDKFKALLKTDVYEFYKDDGGFLNIANILINEIYDMSKESFKGQVIEYIQKKNENLNVEE